MFRQCLQHLERSVSLYLPWSKSWSNKGSHALWSGMLMWNAQPQAGGHLSSYLLSIYAPFPIVSCRSGFGCGLGNIKIPRFSWPRSRWSCDQTGPIWGAVCCWNGSQRLEMMSLSQRGILEMISPGSYTVITNAAQECDFSSLVLFQWLLFLGPFECVLGAFPHHWASEQRFDTCWGPPLKLDPDPVHPEVVSDPPGEGRCPTRLPSCRCQLLVQAVTWASDPLSVDRSFPPTPRPLVCFN